MSSIFNRIFHPRNVEVRCQEAPHAPLSGRLAETSWQPMTDQELLGYERKIIVATLEDLQSKTQTLHDLIIHGPGRHDRQLGLLANLLDDDLQKLKDRLEKGPQEGPGHGRPVDEVDLRELDRR